MNPAPTCSDACSGVFGDAKTFSEPEGSQYSAPRTRTPRAKRVSAQKRRLEQLKRDWHRLRKENEGLKHSLAYLECGLQVLDNEQAIMPIHLSRSMPLLHADSPLALGAQGSGAGQVSVWALPDPDKWDCCFAERVRALSTLDMVLLHRQFLQEMALLLPKIHFFGRDSAVQHSLQQLQDRYSCFNQHAISLAPEAWCQRSKFNLDTLEPYQMPSKEHLQGIVSDRRYAEPIKVHVTKFAITLHKLKSEYQALALHHGQLTGLVAGTNSNGGNATRSTLEIMEAEHDGEAPVAKACRTSSSNGGDSDDAGQAAAAAEAVTSLHEVVALMHANLRRQKTTLKQCLKAMWQEVRKEGADFAKGCLLVYPLPLDAVDYLDIFVDAGIRSTAPFICPRGCAITESP